MMALLTGQATTAQSNLANDPLAMLQIYANAINHRDYTTAYQYLETGESFFDFVAGFASTERVATYFGTLQTLNDGTTVQWRVPAVVSGYQDNGNIRSFAGCFLLRHNGATWTIIGTTLSELPMNAEASHSSIRTYITTANCFASPINLPNVAAPSEGEAAATIRSYFEALDNENYVASYALWLFPIPGPQPNGAPVTDFRPTFNTFASGYRDTTSITLYTGAYQFLGASAGKSYQDGLLPVVLIGMDRTTIDTLRTFYGCYAMGRFVDGRMGIINGRLQLLKEGAATTPEIIDALNIDCTTLGIAT
ncbi:MAG: hypothetical protein Q9P01_13255 [Anaerolineae bacterium]|nr:hypothetical protein [Anaerolineae bacterium]